MAYKHETTRRLESTEFPGVSFVLRKMTEGRRMDLRQRMGSYNNRLREIMKEQATIERAAEEERDQSKWLELQEEFDGIVLEKINPSWIEWGVKMIEGLEADGNPLSVSDWEQWPSALVAEVVNAVRSEAELNGTERKNSQSLTTSGEPEDGKPKLSIVPPASEKGSGEVETVVPSSQIV